MRWSTDQRHRDSPCQGNPLDGPPRIASSLSIECAAYWQHGSRSAPFTAAQVGNRLRGAQHLRALTNAYALPDSTRELSLQVIDLGHGWSAVSAQILLTVVASVGKSASTHDLNSGMLLQHSSGESRTPSLYSKKDRSITTKLFFFCCSDLALICQSLPLQCGLKGCTLHQQGGAVTGAIGHVANSLAAAHIDSCPSSLTSKAGSLVCVLLPLTCASRTRHKKQRFLAVDHLLPIIQYQMHLFCGGSSG